MTIKRINMTMGQTIYDWYKDQASELGVATSALMIIALNEYKKTNIAVENMPGMMNFIKNNQEQPKFPVIDLTNEK